MFGSLHAYVCAALDDCCDERSSGVTEYRHCLRCRFGGGVPCKQMRLIHADGISISDYIGRTLDGVAQNSHLRTQNYYYYSCLVGR